MDYSKLLQQAFGGSGWNMLNQNYPDFFGYNRGYVQTGMPYDFRLSNGSDPTQAPAFDYKPKYDLGEGTIPKMDFLPKVMPDAYKVPDDLNETAPFPALQSSGYPMADNPQGVGSLGAQPPVARGEPGAIPLGLLAAGLGILGNNTGHYGAAGPAIGKGGLIGLQAYGQERDRISQQSQLQQQNRLRDEQLKINRDAAAYQSRKLKRDEDMDSQVAAIVAELETATDPLKIKSLTRKLAVLQGKASDVYKADIEKPGKEPKTQTGAVLDAKGNPMIDPKSGQPIVQEYIYNDATGAYDKPAGGKRLASGGMNISFGAPVAVAGPDGQPRLVQINPQGQVRDIGMAPASTQKATDSERMAKGYHDRMAEAEKLIGGIGSAGEPTEGTAIARNVPIIGAYVERSVMSPAQQKYRQAQEDWVRAKLRKESGAVISKEEMASEIATYFPQPGDGPEVIEQKARSRQIAIGAMQDAAGPALGLPSPRGDFQQQSTFGGGELPKSARMNLKEGQVTTFGNGQAWTLQNGKAVRVK